MNSNNTKNTMTYPAEIEEVSYTLVWHGGPHKGASKSLEDFYYKKFISKEKCLNHYDKLSKHWSRCIFDSEDNVIDDSWYHTSDWKNQIKAFYWLKIP